MVRQAHIENETPTSSDEKPGVQGYEALHKAEAVMSEEKELLGRQLQVVHSGLEVFTETLRRHDVPLVHLDWRPPAQGDAHLLDLMQRLQGPLKSSGERADEG